MSTQPKSEQTEELYNYLFVFLFILLEAKSVIISVFCMLFSRVIFFFPGNIVVFERAKANTGTNFQPVQTQTNQKVKLNIKKKHFWPEDKVNFPRAVIHNHLILLVQNLQWFLLTFLLFSLQ